jgi:uncharacterized protein YdeI (BOF family)
MRSCSKILINFTILLLISACAIPIKKIYKSPERFNGRKVVIKGKVISSLQLNDLFTFTIKDKTGKMMVVTENLLPLQKDKLRVNGVVDKNFIYKEQTIIVVKEKKMKEQQLYDEKRKYWKN